MMIPEKRFLNQIQQVLARLMQPLWLLDTEGTVLLPEENRSKINLPEFMEPGMPVAFEGKTFLMIGITPELILCADAQGAADFLGNDHTTQVIDSSNDSGSFHNSTLSLSVWFVLIVFAAMRENMQAVLAAFFKREGK